MSISNKDNNLHNKRRINEINQTLLINIFKTDNQYGKTLTGVNGEFFYSQILMNVLLHIKTTMNEKNQFLYFCKTELNNNKKELNILDEFKETYSSNQALW